MNAEQTWLAFCRDSGIDPNTPYEAWAFGDDPDSLADLVLKGIKTATASGYDLYAIDVEEPLPKEGDYSVILNSEDEAVCVIRTVKTYTVPYREVSAEHAFKEGEGDRSLAYWRKVHEAFFTEEYEMLGAKFTPESLILCEEFRVCFKAEEPYS